MKFHCAHDQNRGEARCHRVWLVLAALAVSLVGCGRKAPGPDECGTLAEQWVTQATAVTRYAPQPVMVPSRAADIEEIARLCVTTPFDQEVIACARAGGSPERCLQAFADRRRHELTVGR